MQPTDYELNKELYWPGFEYKTPEPRLKLEEPDKIMQPTDLTLPDIHLPIPGETK